MGSSCDQLGIAVRTTVVHKENLHCTRTVISSSGFVAFLRLCFSWDCFKFEYPFSDQNSLVLFLTSKKHVSNVYEGKIFHG